MLALSCGAHVWVLGDPYHRKEPLHYTGPWNEQCSLRLNLCDSPAHGGTPTASFCWGLCNPEGTPFGVGILKRWLKPSYLPRPPLGSRLEKAVHFAPHQVETQLDQLSCAPPMPSVIHSRTVPTNFWTFLGPPRPPPRPISSWMFPSSREHIRYFWECSGSACCQEWASVSMVRLASSWGGRFWSVPLLTIPVTVNGPLGIWCMWLGG